MLEILKKTKAGRLSIPKELKKQIINKSPREEHQLSAKGTFSCEESQKNDIYRGIVKYIIFYDTGNNLAYLLSAMEFVGNLEHNQVRVDQTGGRYFYKSIYIGYVNNMISSGNFIEKRDLNG